MNHSSRAILLASGGMDSTVLAYWLLRRRANIIPLFIDYGQHSRRTELRTLKEVLPSSYRKQVRIVKMPEIYSESTSRMINEADLWKDRIRDEDLHLPHRNLLLLATAFAFAESRVITTVYAAFIETHRALGADSDSTFFRLLAKVISWTGKVTLKLPFCRLSKAEVARIGVRLNAPIARTFSCLAAATIPCGACPNCVDRAKAFAFVT